MRSDNILDSHLYIRLDLGLSLKINSEFKTTRSNKAHLANQLLLYDRVVIPTKDFGIVPILIEWMGPKQFQKSLETGVLGFVRLPSLLGYAGNGNGISGFAIKETKANPFEWWQTAMFGPLDVSLELQLKYQCPYLNVSERSKLLDLILLCSNPINWDNDFFMKNIVNESYTDIKNDPNLTNFILQKEAQKTQGIKLNWLKSVAPDEFIVSSLKPIKNGVNLILRVAEINLEICMAHLYGACDIGTSEGAEKLLEGKLKRAGIQPSTINKFLRLLELNNIPDIRIAIESGAVTLTDILKLREKKPAKEFRCWLRSSEPKNERELEKLYVEALGESTIYSSLPVRLIRFMVTTAIGMLDPIAGPLASTSDIFFIEKLLGGYSPKLFLDELGKLPKTQ